MLTLGNKRAIQAADFAFSDCNRFADFDDLHMAFPHLVHQHHQDFAAVQIAEQLLHRHNTPEYNFFHRGPSFIANAIKKAMSPLCNSIPSRKRFLHLLWICFGVYLRPSTDDRDLASPCPSSKSYAYRSCGPNSICLL